MIGVALVLACACSADTVPASFPTTDTARVAAQARPADPWFGPDKVKHFLMSAFIHSATFSISRAANASRSNAQVIAGVSSAAFGIGKEIHDKRRSKHFSAKDLTWDAAGAVSAAALLHKTR